MLLKTLLLFYFLSEILPEISWKEIAEKILFVFSFDVWGSNPGFTSNNFLSEILPEISWKEIGEKILFVFSFDVWGSNPGFTSNKPTHYLLDYGDFDLIKKW